MNAFSHLLRRKKNEVRVDRRSFVVAAAAAGGGVWGSSVTPARGQADEDRDRHLAIVDTHQHLWDLEKFRLPWLGSVPPILNRSYLTSDYLAAAEGLGFVRAVYMEVDVVAEQESAEADHVIELCKSDEHPTVAAVISGTCDRPDFESYARKYAKSPYVKGVRHLLEGAPAGLGLQPQFVKNVQLLGELGLCFDLTVRPTDLGDALKLVRECPDTRFVLDHCGNADVKAFAKSTSAGDRSHDPDQWRRGIEGLAEQNNVIAKISGIVARVPKTWDAAVLAPVINHCLDAFGPDRVVFGSDWPVCLLGASLKRWVTALREVVAERPVTEQKRLLHDNAMRFYGL